MFFAKWIENEQRAAYRITPDPDLPLELLFEDQRFAVANLSANGIAFYFDAPESEQGSLLLQHHQSLDAQLMLGTEQPHSVSVRLEILQHQQNVYRCSISTDQKAHKLLCNYIVEHQKRLIRAQKEVSPSRQT